MDSRVTARIFWICAFPAQSQRRTDTEKGDWLHYFSDCDLMMGRVGIDVNVCVCVCVHIFAVEFHI